MVLTLGEVYGGGSGLKIGGSERLWGFFEASPTLSACIRLRPVRRCDFRIGLSRRRAGLALARKLPLV